MAPSDRPASDSATDGSSARRFPLARRDAVLLVSAVVFLALVVRLVLLGDRVAHWDEGRVGYWIVHYQETGSFAYRRIIHGPFVQHVNRWLFPVVGANDFTMRLPVALASLLLPLSALLFREHLRRVEMVAMALFLSFNPVILYYSRFMRSDLLVAAFMFVAFGLLVRFYDTRRARYLLGAAAFAAFGFASKENAAIYVLTWLGAAGLLADQALFRPRNYDSGYYLLVDRSRTVYRDRIAPWLAGVGVLTDAASARLGRDAAEGRNRDDADAEATNGGQAARDLSAGPTAAETREATATVLEPVRYLLYLGAAAFVFFALSLFFYAPRGAGMAGIFHTVSEPPGGTIGFWEGFASPANFVAMVEGTWEHTAEQFGTWFGQAGDGGEEGLVSVYTEFLTQFVEVMVTKAVPLTAFAIFGFLIERYGATHSRNLVMFAAYGGFVSVLGYPLGTDIFGAWLVVHALVPLSIPAAVGLARIVDWGYEAFAADDSVGVGIAALLLLLVGAQVAMVGVDAVYVNDQHESNNLVQFAQPAGDFHPVIEEMDRIAAANGDDTDVVMYGSTLVREEEQAKDIHPRCSKFVSTLPLYWYFATTDAQVDCAGSEDALAQRLESNAPPMVITDARDRVPESMLEENYEPHTYEMRWEGREQTFWIHDDWRDGGGGGE